MAIVPAIQLLDHRGRPLTASAYESAGTGRRAANWNAPASGPNRVLSYTLDTLRNRARAADRNNPWLWQAIDRLVSNEVGVGVLLRARAPDIEFRRDAQALWDRSKRELDPEGILEFGGLQTQAVRARRVAGEVFIRRRARSIASGLAVPLQIQLIEADCVPLGHHRDLPNGSRIRDGIEFNARGQRTAYWLYPEHPQDDTRRGATSLLRVAARDIIHHYSPLRPGQRRGEPNAVRSLLPAHTFDSYEDAELVRKQTRAPFTGAVTREAYTDQEFRFDPFTGAPIVTGDSMPQVDVEPGTFLGLAPGEKLDLFNADDTGAGLAEYSRQVLLKIAAGFGVPYELVSGDWKNVNDRLVRAVLNEFHRSIEAAQDHLLIHQLCLGVWSWWMDAAVLSAALKPPGNYATAPHRYKVVQARPHGWKYVSPLQDVQAKIAAIDARLTSRQSVIDEQPGPSVEDIDAQLAEDAARAGVPAPIGEHNP